MEDTLSERVTAALEASKTDAQWVGYLLAHVVLLPALAFLHACHGLAKFLAWHGTERAKRWGIVIMTLPMAAIARLLPASDPRRQVCQRTWRIARDRELCAEERAALIYVTMRLSREQREEA